VKLLEHEARDIFAEYGIPVPRGEVIKSPEELGAVMERLGDRFVLKAQVEVGGRGKKGGVGRGGQIERHGTCFESLSHDYRGRTCQRGSRRRVLGDSARILPFDLD